MNKVNKEKLVVAVIVLIFAIFLVNNVKKSPVDMRGETPIPIDFIIRNDEPELNRCCGQAEAYPMQYVNIKSIGFGTDKDGLYIHFNLGGKLPNKNEIPKFGSDQITGLNYYISLDENPFDRQGNRNPISYEANMTITLFGEDKALVEGNLIDVEGKIVKGGYGYDYFVVRYNYREVLVNQYNENIAFSASSIAKSDKHPAGVAKSIMKNNGSAIDPSDKTTIVAKLNLKK